MAQLAVVGISHERHITWSVQGESPSFFILTSGCFGSSFYDDFRQSGNAGFVCQKHLIPVCLLQVVFAEVECQFAQFVGQLSVLFAGLPFEVGTVAYKTVVYIV